MTSTSEKLDLCLGLLAQSPKAGFRHVNSAIAEVAKRHYDEVLKLAKENLAKQESRDVREAPRVSA